MLKTRFSILEVFENLVSRLEFRFSRIEFRVSSFATLEEIFEYLEQSFRGNDLIRENKTIVMNKTINALHYSRKAAFECMQMFFRVVHFLQDTCGSLIYTVH